MLEKLQQLKERYGKWFMPIALFGGFVVDTFTLNQIDQVFDNAILIVHLLLTAGAIVLLFSRETKFGRKFLREKHLTFLQTLMIFSFGALFSGFVIFYTRSGSLTTSWPFLFTMLILMLGTEFRKTYFQKLVLQISIFYIAIIAWATFFVPVIIKDMGPDIFILSTIVSLFLIALFLLALKKINPYQLQKYLKAIIIRVVAITVVFNVLYFTNIIPPIPLSLKYKAVYHEIEKTSSGYLGQYEATPWWNFWQKRTKTLTFQKGDDVFVFTQVFAPTNLDAQLVHQWQNFDEKTTSWVTINEIPLSISGGRKEGYRGFSYKENLWSGTWRVRVLTQRGQNLGKITFRLKSDRALREIVEEQL